MNAIKLTLTTFLVFAAGCSAAHPESSPQAGPATTGTQASDAVTGQEAAVTFSSHTDAAHGVLERLVFLARGDHYGELGFQSSAEANDATLDEGIPMRRLGARDVSAFAEGGDPHALELDLKSVLYIARVHGEVRSSLTVREWGGRWEAESFGHPRLARAVALAREQLVARGVSASSIAVVSASSVGATFLGYDEAGQRMLTPVWDVEGTSLRAGKTIRAEDAFAALKPRAEKRAADPVVVPG